MGRALIALAVLLLAAANSFADSSVELKSGDFTIQVDVKAQANLIYHLDCVARVESCTSDEFEALWREALDLNADDRKKLDQWASLRNDLQQSSGSDRILSVKASVPIFGSDDDLTWSKIRYVEFGAVDASELKRGWSPLMPADTVDRLAAIVDHFRPRFATWWNEHEAETLKFVSEVEAAMRNARAAELLRAGARFYRSELVDRRTFVHLFLLPRMKSPRSRGGVVGAHMAVEIEPNEHAEDRASVIVHELMHHLFARMPATRKAKLADAIVQRGAAGVPAWNLFNEVQATVIGNIFVERNVKTPEQFQKLLDKTQSFYNDEAIDLGARATEKVFEQAMKGGAMRPSFVDDFVTALQAGLGDRLQSPALHLRSMIINADDDASPWSAKLRKLIRPGSLFSMTPLGKAKMVERLDRFPALSVVVVAIADQTPKLEQASGALGVTPAALMATLGTSRGVVVVSQRTTLAFSFVFVARDAAAMDGMIAAFLSCRLKAGVCIRIE